MPTYDYACHDCGEFDALRSLADRNEPCACPACGAASHRVMSHAPRLACTSPQQRRAAEVNERSRHAPRMSRDVDPAAGGYGRLRHPSGCGCCSTKSKGASQSTPAGGMKAQVGNRPWMISH
ncbi:FmdB family transcriptional regulator [Comamonas serinivorans]|uniref:FmdB family transcriptional regulator n=1 Tax=Comamonas serinivorans TaxID=1082851 RepID=A0A1Y0EIX4_9BURK|nr:zinc ribbon domain-containing protein [Comamonas serinivorans]ARU03594.1 FmdB family transcriptional regulator [Comamonas serinivorans]